VTPAKRMCALSTYVCIIILRTSLKGYIIQYYSIMYETKTPRPNPSVVKNRITTTVSAITRPVGRARVSATDLRASCAKRVAHTISARKLRYYYSIFFPKNFEILPRSSSRSFTRRHNRRACITRDAAAGRYMAARVSRYSKV